MKNITPLTECPKSPNCVSTQTTQKNKLMDPIPFAGSWNEAKTKIIEIINSLDRTKLVDERPGYLHFTFKSRVFGFIDDVEFQFDEKNHLIHFRSSSRTGYSDMGVNRKRMQSFTKKFLK